MTKKLPPADPKKVKIASFRTTEGDWFNFSEAAEAQGHTATDILKAAMQYFLDGRLEMPGNKYSGTSPAIDPSVLAGILSRLEALEAKLGIDDVSTDINTPVSTSDVSTPIHTDVSTDDVLTSINTDINTETITDDISSGINTDIDTNEEKPQNPAVRTASKQPSKIDRTSTYGKECLKKLEGIKQKPDYFQLATELVSQGLTGVPLAEKLNDAGFVNGRGKDVGNKVNAAIRLHLEDLEAVTNG